MKSFFTILVTILFISITSAESRIIDNIKVNGNKRISKTTIVEILNFKKGINIETDDLNNYQKKLLESNFFKTAELKFQNNLILINVNENPLINFFYIEGEANKERLDKIYESIQLGPNKIFSENLLNQDISFIKKILKFGGYYNATLEANVSLLDNNTVNILLKINRNEKFFIKDIFFIGNENFKSSTLKDVIGSSEHGWWKFLSSSSLLNEDLINYDKNRLKNFYLNQGFYDVGILATDINIISNNKATITFSIDEGKKYYFSDLEILDTEKNLNDKTLQYINDISKKRLNSLYTKKKIQQLNDDIFRILNLNKIEFVKYDLITKKEKEKIFTTIEFKKSERQFVDTIVVKGNNLTDENVIRRELTFSEGDSFSNYKINKSIDNLKSTGIFKDIKLDVLKKKNDKINIELEVEEQPTGTIAAGVGVGTAGSTFSTGINEKNLLGKGINVDSNVSLGTEKISGNIKTLLKDFNNSGNNFMFNVYAISSDLDNASYENKLVGVDSSIEYEVYNDLFLTTGIGINRDKIDTNSTASALYQSREGTYLTIKGFYNLEIDKRDSRYLPTKGHRVGFGQNLAVPGSDITFLENDFYSSYYYPFSKDFIFNFKSGLSTVNSLNNKDVKLSDRKYLTSKKLRGFESFGVGPKDGEDHVGGNYSAYGSFATTIPNSLPDKWGAKSLIFLDFGNVWGTDYDSSKDSDKIRSSTGLGLNWISPLGPLSFTFSQVLSSADTDQEESFAFQIGSTF